MNIITPIAHKYSSSNQFQELRECSKSIRQDLSLFGVWGVLSVREHGKMVRTPLAAFFNISSMEQAPLMIEQFHNRQHQVLSLLQQHKIGLSIDDLVSKLEITRTAVNQHMIGLERDGFIKKAVQQKSTGGRPGWTYQITDEGINRLPKQYSWFSELLLDTLKEELGSQRLETYIQKVAVSLVPQLREQLKGDDPKEHIQQVAGILQSLGYQAHTEAAPTKKELPILTAHNCVYHDLAIKHPEVCAFDIALLEQLVARKVDHQECMAKGGHACRFAFKNS